MQIIRLADHLARKPARLFEQHTHGAPHHRVLHRALLARQQRLQFLQAGVCDRALDEFYGA